MDEGRKDVCRVCKRQLSRYTCPRCSIPYCSVECYKGHSEHCTEDFYREQVVANMASMRERLSMMKKLKKFEEQQESDVDHTELLLKLSTLDESEISIDDLPDDLKEQFHHDIASGGVFEEPWAAWWSANADIAEIGSSASYFSNLVTELESYEPMDSVTLLTGGKSPSPHVAHTVSALLYAYAFTMRVFNGDWALDPTGASSLLLFISQSLEPHPNTMTAIGAVISQSLHPTVSKSRQFSMAIVSDVISLLHSVIRVRTALLDVHHFLSAAFAEHRDKQMYKHVKKVWFLLVWASDGEQLCADVLADMRNDVEQYNQDNVE